MNTTWKALAVTGAVAALTVSIFVDVPGTTTLRSLVPSMAASASSAVEPHEPYVTPSLNDTYHNATYRFSLAVPQGFTVQEMPHDDRGQIVLLQDPAGNGIQIMVTPFPEDLRQLSADRIRADIPDMQITDVQPVEIGLNHTGIAFRSDNDAFNGDSREVWFVFRGNLYQISTYARLDALLQTLFGTWKFE